MSWFKRLCLFVFGVSGILALGSIVLTQVGPWIPHFRGMLELQWFYITLEVLVCVTGFGLLTCVLVSLFSPRNPKETVVAEVDGGQITVTRAAIAKQAKHVVEADGTCVAAWVGVRVRKRGHVRVSVRVRPRKPIDVIRRGEELYAELAEKPPNKHDAPREFGTADGSPIVRRVIFYAIGAFRCFGDADFTPRQFDDSFDVCHGLQNPCGGKAAPADASLLSANTHSAIWCNLDLNRNVCRQAYCGNISCRESVT